MLERLISLAILFCILLEMCIRDSNDIIKGFDFNREDFKSPAKRNLMIGAEEADYVILADENVTSEEELSLIHI